MDLSISLAHVFLEPNAFVSMAKPAERQRVKPELKSLKMVGGLPTFFNAHVSISLRKVLAEWNHSADR